MNNNLPSVLASYNVSPASAPHSVIGDEDIPSPAHTVIGSEVLRDNALIRKPGAHTYLAPPHTHIELVRNQALPPVPNIPFRLWRSSRQPLQGRMSLKPIEIRNISQSTDPHGDNKLLSPHDDIIRSYVEERLFENDPEVISLMKKRTIN